MLNEADRRYLDLLKRCLTASVYDESAWSFVRTHVQVRSAPGNRARAFWALGARALKLAADRSLLLLLKLPFDAEKRAEGKDWPLFAYTMVGHKRLDNVQACVEDVVAKGVPGDLVETGVWRGGTVIFMRAVLKALNVSDRTIWACDSFEGLPKPTEADDGQDVSEVDFLKVSLEQVQDNFRRFDLLDAQVKFLKGWFSQTLPTAPIGPIAVLRLDGDMYESTMDALNALYDRVSDGGFIIVDDYFSWPSCKRAVGDFLSKRNLTPELQTIDWTAVYWQVRK